MARRRPRYWVAVVTALIVFVLSVPLGFAINAASGLGRWPGWLDIVRRHPFRSVSVLAVASLVVLAVAFWEQRRSPEVRSRRPRTSLSRWRTVFTSVLMTPRLPGPVLMIALIGYPRILVR